MSALPSKLLVVTDRHQAVAPLPDVVASWLDAGLGWLWLRDRDIPRLERLALAEALARLTREAGAVLTIGADIDLALAVGARGIHLRGHADIATARQRLGAETLVGLSAHSLADVGAAKAAGADYVTLSPIFPSASKPGYGPALGLSALGAAAVFGLPVLALGGVSPDNARGCLDAGAAGVAVMGAAMRLEAPAMAVLIGLTRRA